MGTQSHSTLPWNNWYHITAHTYGSWLRGDPRGWRSRHHREHVDGDYKHPPAPGTYTALHARSKSLMTRDPVKIAADLRQFVVNAVAEKLLQDGIEVLIVALSANHLHALARFPDHAPRHWIGRAKKHASHAVRQHLLREASGGLWAKRCRAEAITGRGHQVNTFKYVRDHVNEGARVWQFDQTWVQ